MRTSDVGWRCKKCGRGGTIDIGDAGPYSGMLLKVDDAHRAAAPWCRPSFRNYEFVCEEAVGK